MMMTCYLKSIKFQGYVNNYQRIKKKLKIILKLAYNITHNPLNHFSNIYNLEKLVRMNQKRFWNNQNLIKDQNGSKVIMIIIQNNLVKNKNNHKKIHLQNLWNFHQNIKIGNKKLIKEIMN